MAKKARKTVWVCQECGYESPKYLGRCICGAWNSMVEETVPSESGEDARGRGSIGRLSSKPVPLRDVGSAERKRIRTGIGELDRVLGGGLVPGSLTLISGEPGIGKSTLIVQAAARIAAGGETVLYVSGEESEQQIRMRADRVAPNLPDSLYVMAETDLDQVEEACRNLKPGFLIIDSIQTMYTSALDSAPGSVSQVRACGGILMKIGKTGNIPVFIVAHVTKSGDLAGPKIVEHLVDCVLNFSGERDQEIRILRAFKNRFGTTSEIGAFRMEQSGLVEINNLSASFLENSAERAEGSVITAVYEGSRTVLLEVQALTAKANVGFARRTSVGIDYQRLSMIIAVLEKRVGLSLLNEDVYVNVVGGLRPDSTSVDLGVALAIFSSVYNFVSEDRTIAIGEVGLTGSLRSVAGAAKIAQEAGRLGYKKIILPERNAEQIRKSGGALGIQLLGARNLSEAVRAFRAKD
ncbi:MAG: DNA repair protein RadA [Eubacteriales bacterium]|nr:DNA repair protein RadA [Eubacteriales bacterium]